MQKLNFPNSTLKLKSEEGRLLVHDGIRKRWLVLTPEEYVRQHLILYLSLQRGCPKNLMSVEKVVVYNGMKRRSDLVVYGRKAKPLLLAECKAPEIKITQSAFDQAARYNMTLRVPFMMITNGMDHYCCHIDFENQTWTFLSEIPTFAEMQALDL